MASIDYVNMTTTEILKVRMKDSKKKLSALRSLDKQKFFSFVIHKEPSYDSYHGGVKMTNAWNGKTPDLRITELITMYVQVVEADLKNQKQAS